MLIEGKGNFPSTFLIDLTPLSLLEFRASLDKGGCFAVVPAVLDLSQNLN